MPTAGAHAVFPGTPRGRGMYESFYLRAVAPDEPLGVWIRYTAHKRPDRSPRGSVWCTFFDGTQRRPFMHKLTSDALSIPGNGWIAVEGSALGPRSAEGACGEASWSLRIESAEPELRHLPRAWMYRAPLPRTKLTSPAPAARFDGTFTLAGTSEPSGAPRSPEAASATGPSPRGLSEASATGPSPRGLSEASATGPSPRNPSEASATGPSPRNPSETSDTGPSPRDPSKTSDTAPSSGSPPEANDTERPPRTVELDGWRGMVGHNWGAEHAERWIWLSGLGFEEDPTAWLDVAIGRVRVGAMTSPWIANGVLCADGHRYPLGGLGARGLLVAETPRHCRLSIPGAGGVVLEAHVDSPATAIAGWRYADPDGGGHEVANCSIASLRLTVNVPGTPSRTLSTDHGAAYELGMREHDHGIELAPFCDG